MANLYHRAHSSTNASLISMMQRFSDIIVIFIGLYAVAYLNSRQLNDELLLIGLTELVVFQMFGGITDFYRSWRGVRLSAEIILIYKNWTLSVLLTAGIVSLLLDSGLSLMLFVQWYALVAVGFFICRTGIRIASGMLRKMGYNTRRVAVVGSVPAGIDLLKGFIEQPWLGFIPVGVYDDNPSANQADIQYGGNFDKLIEDARDGKIDRIYIAMDMADEAKIKDIVRRLTDTTCSVLLIPSLFTFNILHSRTEEINNIPVVPLFDTPLNGINRVFKRLEDIVVSSIILVLISIPLIIIACTVKFTSPGPVLFRQTRYGMDGKPIKVWKFRSMSVMENDAKVIQAKQNDPRVTRIGKFLRNTSLDELPQFFNVLFGQMSVVGPRPHAVAHNEEYRVLIEGYMLRHKVKPGITGLAQISGFRGETDTLDKMQKRVEYDLLYIRNWSVWLDIKIIFLTIFKGFISKAAY